MLMETPLPKRLPRPEISVLAESLGWFSLALAGLEVFASNSLGSWLGLSNSGMLLRGFGMREAGVGFGILSGRKRAHWLWSRVAGDAFDIATLAGGLAVSRRRGNIVVALVAVLGVTALDVACAKALSDSE